MDSPATGNGVIREGLASLWKEAVDPEFGGPRLVPTSAAYDGTSPAAGASLAPLNGDPVRLGAIWETLGKAVFLTVNSRTPVCGVVQGSHSIE